MKKYMVIFALILCSVTVNAAEKITLSTLDWEPYIGKEIKNNGYVAVLVKEAFRRGGLEADFQFDRWSRVVGLAKSGQVDGYFPEYFSESVKAYAVFSDPFPGGPIGFFKLKRKDISFNRLEDLKGLKIGTVKGYVNTKEFDAADYLNKDAVKDDLTNFKKLAAGRLDLVVADKFVGLNLIKKHMPDKAGQIEFMAKFLEEKDLFVCISNKVANADAKVQAFNAGLKQMKADGTIDKILTEYGF
jgi:polar amino acid transport system substrate-binding protein